MCEIRGIVGTDTAARVQTPRASVRAADSNIRCRKGKCCKRRASTCYTLRSGKQSQKRLESTSVESTNVEGVSVQRHSLQRRELARDAVGGYDMSTAENPDSR